MLVNFCIEVTSRVVTENFLALTHPRRQAKALPSKLDKSHKLRLEPTSQSKQSEDNHEFG
ncbi:hypothetical protein H6G33_04690 [Calothrix sp. FACHB-1219]|uniref:hypothetical protein n=1 Tax=unclassified Calothrix TaxID=2619626 RepID=UPI001685E8F2|nr:MULTISPECIES: hypothetical protein [unclassified Calothrix]MBD2203380.1 hypothetical protein [Calothrix sp. FACHB-168]MBD2216323.1 hypothetical protein [Calothrix sp. FACHB-1219]